MISIKATIVNAIMTNNKRNSLILNPNHFSLYQSWKNKEMLDSCLLPNLFLNEEAGRSNFCKGSNKHIKNVIITMLYLAL